MKRYVTDANNTLSQDELKFTRNPNAEFNLITCRPDVAYQRISGFGGAFTEAAANVFALMPPELQDRFLLLCFGGAKDGDPAAGGNAYSLCRTHIQSCDFALSNYSYVRPFDSSLRSFTISRDRQLLLPFIKCGLAVNPRLQLFASPWSPPAFMKTNRRMNGGGKLRRSQYEAWAEVLAKYVDAYAREGVRISRMSVQNEPMASQAWDSCLFSAEEEAQFAAAYLRPALDASGHGDVKLFAWDHNTDKILSRVQSTFRAPVGQAGKLPLAAAGWRAEGTVASDAFAGVAFHWYAGDHFEQVDEVARRWPDKELLFTEGCVEYTRGEERKATQERKAEQYAHAVIGSLNAGAAGFIDWNLLLNEKGGPNHARNFCEAPLMYDRDKRELVANRSFFYMAHFSRFAPVGSRRFLTSRYTDDLETVGFLRPDGSRALVVLNRHARPRKFLVSEGVFTAECKAAGHSITTLVWDADEVRDR